jgi:hypothetical protein
MNKIYRFRSNPLEEVSWFVDGERYVTSSGDVLEWDEEIQDFKVKQESPLDLTLENNIMENLTDIQLKLFWKLCK